MLIKRWESRKGKYWVELHQTEYDGQPSYHYKTDNGGGNMGNTTLDKALEHCYRQCNYSPSSMQEVNITSRLQEAYTMGSNGIS